MDFNIGYTYEDSHEGGQAQSEKLYNNVETTNAQVFYIFEFQVKTTFFSSERSSVKIVQCLGEGSLKVAL